jgi:hypothetical protein
MPRQNTHYCNRDTATCLLIFSCVLIQYGIIIQNMKKRIQNINLLDQILDNVPDLENIEDAVQKEMVCSNLESIMRNFNPINSLYSLSMIITSLFLILSTCLSNNSLEKEMEDMITTTNENKTSETKDKTNETEVKTNETEVNTNETEHKLGRHFKIK